MKRTLETALLSLDWLIEEGVPIKAHAGWQETTAKPCDTGSDLRELVSEFPGVDFSEVDPVYPDKTSAGSPYAPTGKALRSRGQTVLTDMRRRKEKAVVVVSHSGFMREAVTGCWFNNADYRIFDFVERGDRTDEPHRLKQRSLTEEKEYDDLDKKYRSGGLKLSWDERVPIGKFPAYIPEE